MCEFENNSIFTGICRLDGSPISLIESKKSEGVERLYNIITKVLPAQLSKLRTENNNNIELWKLDSEFIESIKEYAHVNVGYLYEEYFKSLKFNDKLNITIKELFFQKIVEYKISYKERQSYQILDSLIFSSDSYTDENGNQIFLEPTEIRLSTLLGHRFDGDVYDFNEKNTSYIALKTSGLIMFTNVTRMMRYLMRQSSLYIDYPQYYTIINGEELVKPLKLCELHRNIAHNSSNPKECTYYNNNWVGNSNITTNHPNSIMAILSYLKYSLLEKPEGYIYKSSKKVKEIEYNPTTIINKTKIGCKTVFSALMEEDDD